MFHSVYYSPGKLASSNRRDFLDSFHFLDRLIIPDFKLACQADWPRIKGTRKKNNISIFTIITLTQEIEGKHRVRRIRLENPSFSLFLALFRSLSPHSRKKKPLLPPKNILSQLFLSKYVTFLLVWHELFSFSFYFSFFMMIALTLGELKRIRSG